MEKNIYNMLVPNSVTHCALASTGALAFSNCIAPARGSTGILYIDVSGFHTATGGITVQLYSSYDDTGTFFFNTAIPAIDTATQKAFPVTLGKYNRIKYNVGAEDGMDHAFILLETHDEV